MSASFKESVHVYELSAHSSAVIKQRTNVPLVSIAIGARGGSHHETPDMAGVTALMARTSIKGTATHSAVQIAEIAETMGGSISPSVSADIVDWGISVPAKHFDAALELLADVVFNPVFPQDEFEIERKLALADVHQTRDDMYRYPLRLCLQQAFRGHPYGNSITDVEAALATATPETLVQWHAQEVRASPWAFVVGDVEPDAAARAVERVMPASSSPYSRTENQTTWPGASTDAAARDKAQTAIAIAFSGPDWSHVDGYALQILANSAGGLGGRFFEELRSKRSLAYTVALLPIVRWLGGAFVAYIATSPEREDEARVALFEQFAGLISDPLSSTEIERAQRYTIGMWQIRSQTNGSQLADLMHAYLIGTGAAEIAEFEERIMNVTAADVVQVAQKYFDPTRAVQGTVRGQA